MAHVGTETAPHTGMDCTALALAWAHSEADPLSFPPHTHTHTPSDTHTQQGEPQAPPHLPPSTLADP